MKLKYYGEFPNVNEAIKYYDKIFEITIIKDGLDGHHGYIKLFNQISIHLHKERQHRDKPGYYIIRFEDHELELFEKTIDRIKNSGLVSILIDKNNARWKTTFFEFRDKYGYTWDLEIKTLKIN